MRSTTAFRAPAAHGYSSSTVLPLNRTLSEVFLGITPIVSDLPKIRGVHPECGQSPKFSRLRFLNVFLNVSAHFEVQFFFGRSSTGDNKKKSDNHKNKILMIFL